jgi:hypothetical protein
VWSTSNGKDGGVFGALRPALHRKTEAASAVGKSSTTSAFWKKIVLAVLFPVFLVSIFVHFFEHPAGAMFATLILFRGVADDMSISGSTLRRLQCVTFGPTRIFAGLVAFGARTSVLLTVSGSTGATAVLAGVGVAGETFIASAFLGLFACFGPLRNLEELLKGGLLSYVA